MDETNRIVQQESIKVTKNYADKYGFELKLLGIPEDNKDRVGKLIDDLNAIIDAKKPKE